MEIEKFARIFFLSHWDRATPWNLCLLDTCLRNIGLMEKQQLSEMLVWWRQQVLLLLVWCADRADLRPERERKRERVRVENFDLIEREKHWFQNVFMIRTDIFVTISCRDRVSLQNFVLIDLEIMWRILIWWRKSNFPKYWSDWDKIFHTFALVEAEKVSEILVWWRKSNSSKCWCDGDNKFSLGWCGVEGVQV